MTEILPPEDWGDSRGAALAQIQEANSHKRFERKFQINVLLIMMLFILILIGIDILAKTAYVKDIVNIVLPVVAFLLGKTENRTGNE